MNPRVVQAMVVASAIRMYLKTGLQANTAYTPKNMRMTAGGITGKKYARNQLQQAAEDLEAWVKEQHPRVNIGSLGSGTPVTVVRATCFTVEVCGDTKAVFTDIDLAKAHAESLVQSRRGMKWEREHHPHTGLRRLYLWTEPETLDAVVTEVPFDPPAS